MTRKFWVLTIALLSQFYVLVILIDMQPLSIQLISTITLHSPIRLQIIGISSLYPVLPLPHHHPPHSLPNLSHRPPRHQRPTFIHNLGYNTNTNSTVHSE